MNKKRKKPNFEPVSNHRAFFQEVNTEFLVHELKDPVSIIETSINMLLEGKEKYGNLTSSQEKILTRSLRNTKKAWELLNNLLEIGRSDSNTFNYSWFQPAQVASNVLIHTLELMSPNIAQQIQDLEHKNKMFEFLTKKGICFDIPPQIANLKIMQDKIKFSHIIGNLFKNAFYHQKNQVKINIKQDNDLFLLEVSDNGPGIDPNHHNIIFQKYTQLKETSNCMRNGHGLGLACARILARSLGGDIKVKSKKGEGASFELSLPFISSEKISD